MYSKTKTSYFILCLLLLSAITGNAQEYLTGVTSNPILTKAAKESPRRDVSTPLRLPFLEEFSTGTGYPDPTRWSDRQAFVNNTYPVFPPSLGVATLDALDAEGRVYAHAERTSFPADTLTSNLIRLDSNFTLHRPMYIGDSLYFSFYYQPGGGCKSTPPVPWERIGDEPEWDDKLILEFGYATGNMIHTGFIYGDYTLGENEYHIAGDTIDNPFIPGTYYIFESAAYPGETILIPADSVFGPEYVWNEVWSTHGCSVDSWIASNPFEYFKQVMIPITDEQYLRSNFQFRFRNYASLDLDSWSSGNIVGWSSNCDQWHIDYIRLDMSRNAGDLYPTDVAFVSPTTSALTEYQAMPWNQFRPSDMDTRFHNDLSNLSSTAKNTYYHYSVVKEPNTAVYQSETYNRNAEPYSESGLHTYDYHATPPIDFTYTYDGLDSATFRITHVFSLVGSNDDCKSNDSCVFEQKFHNYYAYDDGTAEAGYCLLSSMSHPEASLAVQFTLAQPDTLRSIRMWFNSALNDENIDYFTLMVWGDNNGEPGDVIYSLPSQLPGHASEFGDFVSYYPEEPIPVEGTFYVGFYQNHAVQLNLGFDQNNDARGHFFYKVASDWTPSYYRGAPMIRPVLGKTFDHSAVSEHTQTAIKLYPNPTTGTIRFEHAELLEGATYQLFDVFGKLLQTQPVSANGIQLGEYADGLYFVRILQNNQIITTEKIIKKQ